MYEELGKSEERRRWMEKANTKMDVYLEGKMKEAEDEKVEAETKNWQGGIEEAQKEAEARYNTGGNLE